MRSLYVQVVDDDDAVRDAVMALLRASGLPVRGYASPRTFLEHYHPEETGCVLVDMCMPEMTGADVQEKLARIGDMPPPIIVITGHGDVRMAVDAMKRGAVEFLQKPVAPEDLVEAVRKCMRRRMDEFQRRERIDEAQARIGVLTPRERDVLKQLLRGRPNKIIARELGLSPRTVEIHRARVMEKTGAGSLPTLVRMAMAAGLDPEPSR
jgi:two-component system, LuxR family, response regulator FixJ